MVRCRSGLGKVACVVGPGRAKAGQLGCRGCGRGSDICHESVGSAIAENGSAGSSRENGLFGFRDPILELAGNSGSGLHGAARADMMP